jgi:hypothetical protein
VTAVSEPGVLLLLALFVIFGGAVAWARDRRPHRRGVPPPEKKAFEIITNDADEHLH